ncbi:hypothetical protein DV454_003625 [Geotrichum candidum]|nr:hypothetical protein DV454_003625 [Geotrichum candidum]
MSDPGSPQTQNGPVDRELQANITNLVSALGGPDLTLPNKPYVLGHDALMCLRDLKIWLRVVDEKRRLLDVARAISETSLVTQDLLEILSQWDQAEEEKEINGVQDEPGSAAAAASVKAFRIALGCLELLVPLTWPIKLDSESTESQFHHAPALNQVYLRYKDAVLSHHSHRIFRAIIRLCLPALQSEPGKRSSRDEGILKLAVYFIRNILCINLKDARTVIAEDISRSFEISVLSKQSVLDFIVMIASGAGDLFVNQNAAIMECVYYLLYGLKIHQVLDVTADFKVSTSVKAHQDLKDLLASEKAIKRSVQRKMPSRHNRFGTMLSVSTGDNDRLTVSGQPALLDSEATLGNLDSVKKWKKPKRVDVTNRQQWDIDIMLSEESRQSLKQFVNDFLESAYNPLFISIRKVLEREMGEYSKTLLQEHEVQFLYLAAWFLRAERARNVVLNDKHSKDQMPDMDFSMVAGTLNQNMFVIIMHAMRTSFENKEWHIVYAAMLCFKEVIYTVNDMEAKGVEEMREMAENIKSRLFYEEYSLELLSKIPKTAHARDISYLNLAVELTHIVLKTLERYSTDKNAIYIGAKRRRQRNKKKRQNQNDEDGVIPDDVLQESDSEVEREKAAKKVVERKFNFQVFESKFLSEETLNSYIKYLGNYKELNKTQLMYAIKFFHRIFARRKLHYFFYRLDLMKLFSEIAGTGSSSSSQLPLSIDRETRNEITNFVRYYVHKLIPALERTPSLFVEILFQKSQSDFFYFEHGFDKPAPEPRTAKAKAGLMFADDAFAEELENKFAIVVAALIDDEKGDLVEWAIDALNQVYQRRASWIQLSAATPEAGDSPLPPDEPKLPKAKKAAMQTNGDILSDHDEDNRGYDDLDGFVVRGGDDDDDDAMSASSEEEKVLSDGGTTTVKRRRHKSSSQSQNKKKKRRRLYRNDEDDELVAVRRQKERQEKELLQFKSTDYVHDSDDELTPEELAAFFESEQRIRDQFNAAAVYSNIEKVQEEEIEVRTVEEELRRQRLDMDSDIEMEDAASDNEGDSDSNDRNDQTTDEEENRQTKVNDKQAQQNAPKVATGTEKKDILVNDDDGDDAVSVTDRSSPAETARGRKIIVDSDDEE